MDNKLLHLRLGPDAIKTLDELCFPPFSRQQVATMILEAAVAAVRENANKMSFPPSFEVVEGVRAIRMNEPIRKK